MISPEVCKNLFRMCYRGPCCILIYEEYIRGKIKELRHKTKYWTCPLHVGNTEQFLCLHIRTQLHCSLGLVTHRYRIVTRRAVNLSRGVLCSWNIANTPELKYLLLFLAHVVTVLWRVLKKKKKERKRQPVYVCDFVWTQLRSETTWTARDQYTTVMKRSTRIQLHKLISQRVRAPYRFHKGCRQEWLFQRAKR